METATLAGGCFWCTEAIFQRLRGVYKVTPGYSGGGSDNPTYDDVSSGRSGHAETVQIEFNPDRISYEELLDVFLAIHDPTSLDRQGGDQEPNTGQRFFIIRDNRSKWLKRKWRKFQMQLHKFRCLLSFIRPRIITLIIIIETVTQHTARQLLTLRLKNYLASLKK